MFGRRRYVVTETVDPGEAFGSFMTFLVIIGIIIAFAAMISWYILLVFLGIGALLGLGYALVMYVKAFIWAVKSVGSVHKNNAVLSFIARWFFLFKEASKLAFIENLNVAKSAIINARGYRFLSFRKWMWYIVAPSVMIGGTFLILAVIFANLMIAFSLISLILFLIVSFIVVSYLVYLAYALYLSVKNLFSAFAIDNPFGSLDFSRYGRMGILASFPKGYFCSLFSGIKSLWSDAISLMGQNISSSKNYAILNVVKYFLLISPLSILVASIVITVIAFIVLLIAFVPLFIVEFFWALISLFLK